METNLPRFEQEMAVLEARLYDARVKESLPPAERPKGWNDAFADTISLINILRAERDEARAELTAIRIRIAERDASLTQAARRRV